MAWIDPAAADTRTVLGSGARALARYHWHLMNGGC